jgi:hypothetical protein
VAPSTAIPTTNPLPDPGDAGLWLGARYKTTGMYRSCYNCMMRSLGTPFGDVASEAFVKRLYQGGWGVPSLGVENVEPESVSPAEGPVEIAADGNQTFSAQVLGPLAGPALTVKWLVNGIVESQGTAATGDTVSFPFTPLVPGTYTIQLKVTDTSSLIHADARAKLATKVKWTVTAAGSTGGTELLTNGGFETAGDAADLALGWTEKTLAASERVCGTGAHAGSCFYRVRGAAGVTGKLIQTATPAGGAGDTLVLSAALDPANLTSTFNIKAKVTYEDLTTATLTIVSPRDAASSEPYGPVATGLMLAKTVTSIKVTLTVANAGGKVGVDDLSLRLFAGS